MSSFYDIADSILEVWSKIHTVVYKAERNKRLISFC